MATDTYTDAKFAFIDDNGIVRLAQAKSMTMARANKQESDRVLKQILKGERKMVNVASCVGWSNKFDD